MKQPQEFYALGHDRTARFARAFLDRFLPARAPAQANYPVPELIDEPRVTFEAEDEILVYLEAHPEEPYGLYWGDVTPGSPKQAMLFYTRDGKVIFGLADVSDTPDDLLRSLAAFVGATHSRVTSEERPPQTSTEFVAQCERA